ncbi:NADP-dependent isocitrate dehydrogenase [Sedimentibacter sp. B4]|uniref:NADP-dependent isocitrate dehydrogenase n=1 Tax=Sedimentibacter sp. B4 TaxID=304766 RepID=UPI0002D5534B|nr:NADP-dependent isocitrate dehydrogenase [Sedimentibacter sp. B4]
MEKIKMTTPLVELDGDEMARIIWHIVKEKLILPYVELKSEYYDLHLKNRDNTNDKVTVDAANAIRKYGVGVKCATITSNSDRKIEYDLKNFLNSPNGTIRDILDGTVFRKPITIETITPLIPRWKKPITIARHSYGDIYASTSMEVNAFTKAELVLTDKYNNEKRTLVYDFNEKGILIGEYNLDSSIMFFAESCFKHALKEKANLMFSAKDTVVKAYDSKFKDIFEELYNEKYKEQFENIGIKYTYTLIDDAVSRIIKSEGGIIWACKNYDGDVMSDMIATGFGSLALMTSVLVSPDGAHEYEASHGTVKMHYYRHLKGEKTSTNPIAIIFAWTGALRKRGELDDNIELVKFSDSLEKACHDTINNGIMTGDLIEMSSVSNKKCVTTEEIIDVISKNIKL